MEEEISIKQESKLLNIFSNLFGEKRETGITDATGVMDSANICYCEAKTEQAKNILFRFGSASKLNNPVSFELGTSSFSTEYLTKILKILDVLDEKIKLQSGNNQPLIIENSQFKFLLAPRVEDD